MSVEFRFTGFFDSVTWKEITELLKEEKADDKYPGLELMLVKLNERDRIVFDMQGHGCEYYWLEAMKIIKNSSPVQYMSLSYCDHDDDGIEVDALLGSNTYQGYMSFDEYWNVVNEIEYLDKTLLAFEQKLQEGSIKVKPIVDSEEV